MPNLKKNFRESIFVTPKSIPLAGRRRRIFYTAKKDRPSSFETICKFAQIRSAQCLPSEKRGASVLHSWANAISRWLDTALYLMSALGRNLNFNAVVCAEYFWRRAVERLIRKVKFDSQIHRSSRLCRQRALFKKAQLNLIGFLAATCVATDKTHSLWEKVFYTVDMVFTVSVL